MPQGTPSVAAQKREHFAKGAAKSNGGLPNVIPKAVEISKNGAVKRKPPPTSNGEKSVKFSKPQSSPTAAARQKERFKNKRLKLAPRKKYKVLNNGVVNNGTLTKRKERIIYNQVPEKLKNRRAKAIQNRKIKADKGQAELIQMAMGGSASSGGGKLKKLVPMGISGTKKVYRLAKKPVELLKQEFYSKGDKNETGAEAAKLGLKTYDYAERGIKTAAETGVKTVKKGARLTKRVYRKLHKTSSAQLRRTLRKRVVRNKLKTQVNYLAKQAVRKGTKAAGKAAANTAKNIAKSAFKAAKAAAKAAVSAVSKVVGFIVETMPWSLIVIGVILIILIIALMFGSIFSGAGGSVAGGGAWLVDDNSTQTPEEIYEGYKEFVEQAKEVMESQAKQALQNEVTAFCDSDTEKPRKIIQYIDKNNNRTFYPAKGADNTINSLIDEFGTDDYADYMSLLFVLMTREKQQADGVTDEEIYDFDFKKEDFEEFMKTVNENSCRWGDTFVIKKAVETSPEACPGQNCKTKYLNDRCASYTDEDGRKRYYCKGHKYCPVDHTKLTVKLYTVKDYYGMEYPEIYNFTENEKARYEASKAIIQGLLDYWE